MRLPENPLIIGAGPCGLCVGWNFSNDNIPVTILEKQKAVGGLSLTFEDEGYLFDLGPHNLHPKYEDIKDFLVKMMGDDMKQYDLSMEIIFRKKRVKYPLHGIQIFTVLPPFTMMLASLNFLFARLRMFLSDPERDETFQDWITNRFGKVLYNIYFGPYAEKAWKIGGLEISGYVATRRVPVLSLTDYIRRALKKELKHKHTEDGNLDNFYLRKGVGQLSERFAEDIIKSKGRIILDSKILRVKGKNNRIESVVYEMDGTTYEEQTDFLFSTMPLSSLIELLDMDVPDEVCEAAQGLDFCAERLVFIKVNNENLNIPMLLYFSDPDIKFNRIFKFHKDCSPRGKTGICVEFTCNVGDDTWRAKPENLYDYSTRILVEHNILRRHDIDGYAIREVEHAYPRFRVGFENRMRTVLTYLSTFHNLITLGRQGLFRYANIDDVLHMAFRGYEALNTLHVKGIDYADIFPRHISI